MKLFDPPSASFDDPIDILDGCHQRVLRFSALAVRIAEEVRAHGANEEARNAARSVVRYFDDAGAKHHRDEEEDLFPALERAIAANEAPALKALIARLRADHQALDRSWRAVRGALQALIDGKDAPPDAAAAEALAQAYRAHIALEERELLPLARRVLDAGAVESLGRSMAARRGVRPRPPGG